MPMPLETTYITRKRWGANDKGQILTQPTSPCLGDLLEKVLEALLAPSTKCSCEHFVLILRS